MHLKWGVNLSNNQNSQCRNENECNLEKSIGELGSSERYNERNNGNIYEGKGYGSPNGSMYCDENTYCYSSSRSLTNKNGNQDLTKITKTINNSNVLVGEINFLSLKHLTRIMLDVNDVKIMEIKAAISIPQRRAELYGHSKQNSGNNRNKYCACFLLESISRVGKVVLAYRSISTTTSTNEMDNDGKTDTSGSTFKQSTYFTQEIWLQDLSGDWWYLCDSFSSYYRMILVHLGITGWHSNFTSGKADGISMQWMRLFIPERLHADRVGIERELRLYKFYRNIILLRNSIREEKGPEKNDQEQISEGYQSKDKETLVEALNCVINEPPIPFSLSSSEEATCQNPCLDANDYVQNYYRHLMEFGNSEVNINLYNYQAIKNKNSALSKSLNITNCFQKKTIGVKMHPSLNNLKGGRLNDNTSADLSFVHNEKNMTEKISKSSGNVLSNSNTKISSSSSRRPSTRGTPFASSVRRISK